MQIYYKVRIEYTGVIEILVCENYIDQSYLEGILQRMFR